MGMANGTYRTAGGSTVTISGAHSGIATVDFDWFEEDACIDCEPSPYPEDGRLVWTCTSCQGGSAELLPVSPAV